MIRWLGLAPAAAVALAITTGASLGEQSIGASGVVPATTSAPPTPAAGAEQTAATVPVDTAQAAALRSVLANLEPASTDEERNENAALAAFYEERGYAPIWVTAGEFTPKASSVLAEIAKADEWGLDARDFTRPAPPAPNASAQNMAATEIGLARVILKYGRYARGGRIINPAEQLSSYIDRRPQLLKPRSILDGIAAAPEPDAYLRKLHPQHPQFEMLRQKYLTLAGSSRPADAPKPKGKASVSADAKRLLANMEQWRWMPADLGEVYIWNNIPDFAQRVVVNGELVRSERIVVGETSKQTPVFSRPMRKITFKPTWIVPDSIKVREIWPSLLRDGGVMARWALQVQTKDGRPVDWRTVDWTKADIREYEVIQPNGRMSVMGKVKFSFPNQHTVFMHDTLERDRHMFQARQRTFSHGCIRVRNPQELAEILMRADKGWEPTRVAEAFTTGTPNNETAIERRILVHTTYFTVMAAEDGKLQTFPDVYGHERRITLALEGKWKQIAKGRDHLAPVELDLAAAQRRAGDESPSEFTGLFGKPGKGGFGDFLNTIFGNFDPKPARAAGNR
jgi:L,D-transpeptidase YcbB